MVDEQDSAKIASEVAEFRKRYQKVQYAFDNALKAYEYVSLVKAK